MRLSWDEMRGHSELNWEFGRKRRVLMTLGLDAQDATDRAIAHAQKILDQRNDIQEQIAAGREVDR